MKIIVSIPGEAYTIPMNRYVPEALTQLGHEVIVFNHERDGFSDRVRRIFSKKKFNQYKNEKLLELVKAEKPDLFFTLYGRPYTKTTLDQVKAMGVPTACWWLNDPFELGFKHHDVSAFDFYFSNSRYAESLYKEKGVKKHFFLPVGYSPSIPPQENIEKKYDIVFAGDSHAIRAEFISKLSQKYSIGLMGPWKKLMNKGGVSFGKNVTVLHDKTFTPLQMAEVFAMGKINLNLHTWYQRFDYGVNPRLMEASGLKSFQLADNKREIAELYIPGKEVVLFETYEELESLVAHYLSHEEERMAIVNAAYDRTMKEHTYLKRMQFMIECVKKG